MRRNQFLKTMAAAIPGVAIASIPAAAGAISSVPNPRREAAGNVKITDVKCMRAGKDVRKRPCYAPGKN
jgi:hypothetical protein